MKWLAIAEGIVILMLLGQFLRVRRHRQILGGHLALICQETSGRKGVVSYLTMQRALAALGHCLGKKA